MTFPIAETALAALTATTFVRTKAEAMAAAGGDVTLVSEWLRPTAEEHAVLRSRLEAGVGQGFVQVYEGPDGQPVFAVTHWRKGAIEPPAQRFLHARQRAAEQQPTETDDLYFMKGRTRPRSRGERYRDPNQMDLFVQPVAAVPDAPALEPEKPRKPPSRRKKV